jgi:hypothetical protein
MTTPNFDTLTNRETIYNTSEQLCLLIREFLDGLPAISRESRLEDLNFAYKTIRAFMFRALSKHALGLSLLEDENEEFIFHINQLNILADSIEYEARLRMLEQSVIALQAQENIDVEAKVSAHEMLEALIVDSYPARCAVTDYGDKNHIAVIKTLSNLDFDTRILPLESYLDRESSDTAMAN